MGSQPGIVKSSTWSELQNQLRDHDQLQTTLSLYIYNVSGAEQADGNDTYDTL